MRKTDPRNHALKLQSEWNSASLLPSSPISQTLAYRSVPERRYVTRRGYFGAVGLVALVAGKGCTVSQTLPLYRSDHWLPFGLTGLECCGTQPIADKWHWLCGVKGEWAAEMYWFVQKEEVVTGSREREWEMAVQNYFDCTSLQNFGGQLHFNILHSESPNKCSLASEGTHTKTLSRVRPPAHSSKHATKRSYPHLNITADLKINGT